jgi:hypothetical protein
MLTLRRGNERGRTQISWLDSRHSFSFGGYQDPQYQGFRSLLVINDDTVAPGGGFAPHSHRDMEIISYILSGALEHNDSLGNGSVIRPGDVQRMSAGTGIQHSEYNHSKSDAVHFLQIWIVPDKQGLPPGYEQKNFAAQENPGKLQLVAAPGGQDGAVTIHQDALMYVGKLQSGDSVNHALRPNRHAWLQLATGSVRVNDVDLQAGDGLAIHAENSTTVDALSDAQVLLFDLA